MPKIQHNQRNFRGDSNVASASSRTRVSDQVLPAGKAQTPVRVLAPPGLLRCLILSWSDQRAQRFQSAAEREAWEAIVCSSAKKFLRNVFQQKIPLTVVDLPQAKFDDYEELQNATAKVCEVSDSLLIICGAGEDENEETWARQLGVWAYVPNVAQPAEFDWVFIEARKALAQQASARVDSQESQMTTEVHLHRDRMA